MPDNFAFDLGDWFSAHAAEVEKNLHRYFDGRDDDLFTGRWFETFAAMGDPLRFESSDVLAVETLSVAVPTESASRLLATEADRFNEVLAMIPQSEDLWKLPRSVIEPDSPAAQLHTMLKKLYDVGYVTAGKLLAAKRPQLIPILDSQVERVLKPVKGRFWVTMYDQLADKSRRQNIVRACASAPEGVALLRRIDVALWMHATQRTPPGTAAR
jgi:hypothetical protein